MPSSRAKCPRPALKNLIDADADRVEKDRSHCASPFGWRRRAALFWPNNKAEIVVLDFREFLNRRLTNALWNACASSLFRRKIQQKSGDGTRPQ